MSKKSIKDINEMQDNPNISNLKVC